MKQTKKDIWEGGIKEKEERYYVIKIATEKQELPPVSENQNNFINFIKPMGKNRSKMEL